MDKRAPARARKVRLGGGGDVAITAEDIQRKRATARRAGWIGLGVWLSLAALHVAAFEAGLARISYAEAIPIYLAVLLVAGLYDLYLRNDLCLRGGADLRWLGLLGVLLHAACALPFFILDNFSYFTVLAITMAAPAGPAFLGLSQGFRGTILVGLLLLAAPMVYWVLPDHPLRIPADLMVLFTFAWTVGWTIGAFANARHNHKKYLILQLFRRQKESNEIIREQNRRMDEKSRELARVNTILEEMSMRDGLTQVANRRRFDQKLDEEWQRAARHHCGRQVGRSAMNAEVLSVILLDIDHFKEFNDTYGHLAGDECLVSVASAVQQLLNRATDLVARYGGEEFVILLPATYPEGALKIAESIRREVESLAIAHAGSPVASVVTVSMGVAGYGPDMGISTPSALLARADEALYAAKRRGRNRVVYAATSQGEQGLRDALSA